MRLRQGLVWVWFLMFASLLTVPGRAAETENVSILDNLFLEAGGGWKRAIDDETTGFGAFGFNWGIPLTPRSEGVAFGLQVGGDFTVREGDDEWNGTAGLFARNLKLGDEQVAGAVLMDYQRTTMDNNLWAVRPILGITLGPRDEIGAMGVIGVNRESSTKFDGTTLTKTTQESPDTAEVFFNHSWTEALMTELAVGYQFSEVDEVMVRGQIVYGITRYIDLSVGGEINGDGNYACGARVSFNFGGTGRHDSINNIYAWKKQDFYTPFPKRAANAGGGSGAFGSSPASQSVTGGGSGGI